MAQMAYALFHPCHAYTGLSQSLCTEAYASYICMLMEHIELLPANA